MSRVDASGKRERGASLIEAAIVLPLLLVIFLGVVDFGVAISDYNQLRQGVRESVRRAVVADVGTSTSCNLNFGGSLPVPDVETQKLMCLTKDKTGLDTSTTRVKVGLESGGYAEGEPLIVCAQYPLSSLSGFFGGLLDGRVVHTQIDMRIEKDTLGVGVYQEKALAGGDWSWCG